MKQDDINLLEEFCNKNRYLFSLWLDLKPLTIKVSGKMDGLVLSSKKGIKTMTFNEFVGRLVVLKVTKNEIEGLDEVIKILEI